MEDGFASDEPFVYRLNDNGSGPSLLVKVRNELTVLNIKPQNFSTTRNFFILGNRLKKIVFFNTY